MSSPQSFMVGSPPQGAGYAGRLVDFGMLSNLAEDYYRGQQARRQEAMATAFPDGIPTVGDVPLNQGGRPDLDRIINVGAHTKGRNMFSNIGDAESRGDDENERSHHKEAAYCEQAVAQQAA